MKVAAKGRIKERIVAIWGIVLVKFVACGRRIHATGFEDTKSVKEQWLAAQVFVFCVFQRR